MRKMFFFLLLSYSDVAATAETSPKLEVTEFDAPAGDVIYRVFKFKDGPQTELDRMTAEVMNMLVSKGAAPRGPMYLATLKQKKGEENLWVVEAGIPITKRIKLPKKSPYKFKKTRARHLVSVLHKGPRSELSRAYKAAEEYIKSHSLKRDGAPWESLLSGSEVVPPATHSVAVRFPVKK